MASDAQEARDRLAALLPDVNVDEAQPPHGMWAWFTPDDADALADRLEALARVEALLGNTIKLRNAVRDAIHDDLCGRDRTCRVECESGGSGVVSDRIVAVATLRSLVLGAIEVPGKAAARSPLARQMIAEHRAEVARDQAFDQIGTGPIEGPGSDAGSGAGGGRG